MKTRLTKVLCCLTLISAVASAAAKQEALVQVTVNQQLFQFTALPRLAEVLAPVALQQDWYWPAAALYKHTEQPEQLRSQVLATLSALQQDAAPELQLTLQSLSEQVSSWQLAERIAQPIDYDVARIKPAANPAFTAGNYTLRLVTRPTEVTVIGAVARPGKLNHQAATSVTGYIQQITPLYGADNDTVVVISPGGEVTVQAAGYWLNQHVELMPGATLLIPLAPGLFNKQISDLNNQLSELARHRVFS